MSDVFYLVVHTEDGCFVTEPTTTVEVAEMQMLNERRMLEGTSASVDLVQVVG